VGLGVSLPEDDPNSKSLRERLDALLRRAREISAEIERRVDEVTAEPPQRPEVASDHPLAAPGSAKPPDVEVAQQALNVAAEAVAVTAEAAAVTAEALSTIANENAGGAPPIPEAPPDAPTTVIPEAAVAVAADARDAARTDENGVKDPAPGPAAAAPSGPATPSATDKPDEGDA
jgi:hypothetical protein